MPWTIENGQPVKVVAMEPAAASATEETPDVDASADDVLVCPYCGREYKTEHGLDRHVDTAHNG